MDLLQGPSQNLAGQVLRQCWQHSWAELGWNLQALSRALLSWCRERPVVKGPKEELCSRLWPSPTFCFWGSLSSMACDLSAPACNLPEGNAVGPTQGYRQHPDNPGENEQMALPQQDVGVAALS